MTDRCGICGHRYRRRLVEVRRGVHAADGPVPSLVAPDFHACMWCVGREAAFLRAMSPRRAEGSR